MDNYCTTCGDLLVFVGQREFEHNLYADHDDHIPTLDRGEY
jgi:hypothetical protein